METEQNVGGRDRLARAVLTVVLSIVALRWLKRGKKGRGLLAGIGALGFGFNTVTGYCGINDTLDIDTTAGEVPGMGEESEDDSFDPSVDVDMDTAGEEPAQTASTDGGLTCAFCGEAIRPGQRRGPNDQDQIVHENCA